MNRILAALTTLALLAMLSAGCATSSTTTARPVRMEAGDYTGISQWYRVQGGVRYAYGIGPYGAQWYYLKRPLVAGGYANGENADTPECWCNDTDGPIRCYQRTYETMVDPSKQPVFIH